MKNIIAAIVSFIILGTITYLMTYLIDAADGEMRTELLMYYTVIIGLSSWCVPLYFIIVTPLKTKQKE